MKRKRLALLLAAALTVTSVDGTAFAVSGADFSSEPAEEALTDETAEVSGDSSEDEFSVEEEQQEALQPEDETAGETEEVAGNGEETDSEELSQEEGLTSDDSATEESQADAEVSVFSAGEEEGIDAESAAAVISVIPDTQQNLSADQDYNVEITEDSKEAWFSFTPQEDGTYFFTSSSDNCDPMAYVYDKKDVTDKEDCLKSNDDGIGINLDFKLTVNMKKGTTYYFCAQLVNSDETGNFTVRLEKQQKTPSSVQINMGNVVQTEFMADIDNCTYLPGLELTVGYGEGTETQTITFSGWKNRSIDEYGNEFSYVYRSSNGEDTGNYNPGTCLAEGAWKVAILCNDNPVETNEASFQVKTPDNLQKLHTGEGNTIECSFDLCKWYTFTAPETAEYTISPVNNVLIYTQKKDSVSSDIIDDKCVVSLEKDQTYYIGFTGGIYIDGSEVSQWNVNIGKKAQIASLEFSEKNLTFTAVRDRLRNTTPVGTLTVKYNNGNSAESVKVPAYGSCSDKYGNRITATLTDSKGDDVDWGDGEELPVETYTLSYSVNAGDTVVKTAGVPLTVKKVAFEDYSKISLGENQIKTSNDSDQDPYYYGFEVARDGVYAFDYDKNGYDGPDLSAIWFRFKDNGDMEEFDPENKLGGLGLGKGRYLVSWYDQNGGTDTTITAKYVPAISSVKVKSWKAYDSTVTEKTGNAFLKELTAEVTCEDGTTEEVKYDPADGDGTFPTDQYGREFFYTFTYSKDANGNYPEVEDAYNLKAGNYVYRVAVGGVYAADIPFKVLSRDDSVSKELTTGTSELKNQTNLLLKYKAPADGRYELAVNIPVTELQIRKVDETELEYMKVTDYRTDTSFEKDQTYYIYVRANEYCPEMKVTVSALTRPESMETTALKKTYIAGIDYFEDKDVQTKISFGGQKSRTVRGTDVVEGYNLQYQVKDSEGREYDRDMPLTAGTWTVTPYLGVSVQTGSAIAVEMQKLPVKSDMITAKKLDLNSLPKLTKDSWTEVANNMHNKKYYAFTAPENGTYNAQRDNELGNGYAVFYADGKDGYTSGDYQITLKKGETCLVGISTLSDLKFRIVKVTEAENPTVTPEPVTEITLTDGMKKDVAYNGKDIKCTFIPSEDGYYVLESSSWKGEFSDTYAELFCGSDWLGSDDDGGENNDFRLIWKLEKGKKYTYLVRAISGKTANFSLSFHKQQGSVRIKDVEILPVSENEGFVPGYSDTILDAIEHSYNLKVTYEDGTSELQDIWTDSDKYGGKFNVNIETGDKPFGESVALKVTVTYKLPWEKKESFKKELTLRKKGLTALKQMEVEKDYPIEFKNTVFAFTPSEDGKYIITAEDQNGGISYVRVEQCSERFSDGRLMTTGEDTEPEGRSASAVTLKAGKRYVISASCSREVTGSIRIQKVRKTLKGLELVKAPEQTTCLPNDTNYVSLEGLQVKALYTDGSSETITYGKTDSSGRQIYKKDIKWLADGSCTVYVNMENYQVGFNLKADSWDNVQEIKIRKKITLKAESGDTSVLKFVPEYTGLYCLDVSNGYVEKKVMGANAEDDCNYWAVCRLTAGKTYYFHILAEGKNPEVTINYKCTDHKWDAGKVTKEATCKEEGVKTYTCSMCGATKTETIAKLTEHKWDTGKVTKEATCKEEGIKTYTCSVCGATKTETIAKLTEHKWDTGKVTKEATCKEEGTKTYTCSVCGATKTETIAKLTEHKWDTGKVTKEATCKEEGVKTYTCSVCGATKTEVIAKTGHKFGKWIKVSDATIKAKQKQKRTCSVCKKEEFKTVGNKLKPTIKLNVTSITMQQKQSTRSVKVTMAKGDSVKSWTSNKKSVATVDKSGLIRAQKENGTAKITVTLVSGKKATVIVKVQSKKIITSKITGLKSSISIVRGNKTTLKPALSPITSQDKIIYSTSNKSIVTVSSKGVITGKKAGTAKITVKAGSKKAVVTVKVTPKVKTTKLSGVPKTKTVSRGKTFTIKATATPKNTEEKITYKSSNSKVATISSKGVVKGIKKGTVTITVQSGSKKLTCKVTVK